MVTKFIIGAIALELTKRNKKMITNKIQYRKLTEAEIASCNGRYKYALTENFIRRNINLGKQAALYYLVNNVYNL